MDGKANIQNTNIYIEIQPSPTLSLYTFIKLDIPLSVLLFETIQPHIYSYVFVRGVLHIASQLLFGLSRQHATVP